MNLKYAECLISLKNTKIDEIPAYSTEVIEMAVQQINQNFNQIKQLSKKSKEEDASISEEDKIFLKGKMVIKIETIYRLKRFLLLFHHHRCQRIQDQFWQFGGEIKRHQLQNLHKKQRNYLLEYKSLVNSYVEDVGLQLTMNMSPPLETIVQIRVLKDCGQIVEQGIVLKKNSVHFIKKSLVQKFIQRGDVIVIY